MASATPPGPSGPCARLSSSWFTASCHPGDETDPGTGMVCAEKTLENRGFTYEFAASGWVSFRPVLPATGGFVTPRACRGPRWVPQDAHSAASLYGRRAGATRSRGGRSGAPAAPRPLTGRSYGAMAAGLLPVEAGPWDDGDDGPRSAALAVRRRFLPPLLPRSLDARDDTHRATAPGRLRLRLHGLPRLQGHPCPRCRLRPWPHARVGAAFLPTRRLCRAGGQRVPVPAAWLDMPGPRGISPCSPLRSGDLP